MYNQSFGKIFDPDWNLERSSGLMKQSLVIESTSSLVGDRSAKNARNFALSFQVTPVHAFNLLGLPHDMLTMVQRLLTDWSASS
jgi:hypothetical protein